LQYNKEREDNGRKAISGFEIYKRRGMIKLSFATSIISVVRVCTDSEKFENAKTDLNDNLSKKDLLRRTSIPTPITFHINTIIKSRSYRISKEIAENQSGQNHYINKEFTV